MFQNFVRYAERLAKVAVVLSNLILSVSVLGLVYFMCRFLGVG